jgi:flagellar biosynthesis protein FlhF
MKLVSFVAENADAALAQIHRDLGPEAVVVSVRKMPPSGISRLWQRNGRLEVTAGIPQTATETPKEMPPRTGTSSGEVGSQIPLVPTIKRPDGGRWRSIAWLESKGLLPAFIEVLEEKLHLLHGRTPLPRPEEEWSAVTNLIICHWRKTEPAMTGTGRPHVFIGPAGSGKTTVLCKWMASAVLLNEQSARVWRLDGETVNASELLTLHCESLGVPVERFWRQPDEPADLHFVDLPGVEADNSYAMEILQEQLAALPQPHVHLVLNAAYENSVLMEQFNAFAPLKPEDIIFTHLDEDRRRVKLWNFVFGTNCPISFLSTGQKIPGDFRRAEPALLFPQKNHRE